MKRTINMPQKKPFKLCALSSGSKGGRGNNFYYEPSGTGTGFMIDCGGSDNFIKNCLGKINRMEADVHSFFITHEHIDHYPVNKRGRKYDTFDQYGGDDRHKWLDDGVEEINYTNCSCKIHRVPMVHDIHCDGFVIESDDGIKVVHITDTAEVPDVSMKYMKKPSGIVIESNWDELLLNRNLQEGSIPGCVLERSVETHLSNSAMADVVEQLMWPGLEAVVLIHLSSTNNSPVLARQAAEEVLERGGFLAGKGDGQCRVIVSEQDSPTELIILTGDNSEN
jgi:phosphoribosyl 1,2-cyclic phosphodiesterase